MVAQRAGIICRNDLRLLICPDEESRSTRRPFLSFSTIQSSETRAGVSLSGDLPCCQLFYLGMGCTHATPDCDATPLTKIFEGLEYATFSTCKISIMSSRTSRLRSSYTLTSRILTFHASGKVRDVYRLDGDHLLFVATDRISAFDYVLATGIPHKGRVLTQISLFWFDFLKDVVPNHLVTADVTQYPADVQNYADQLRGRSMLVTRGDMFPVECVVRGYLSGSGWKEYKATGKVCGIKLPAGLKESDKLPEPIFTPATKATTGHDENISFEDMVKLSIRKRAASLRDMSLEALQEGVLTTRGKKGIIIADTKFEFGRTAGRHHPGRRSSDPGFFALLAGGQVSAGQSAGFFR